MSTSTFSAEVTNLEWTWWWAGNYHKANTIQLTNFL